jgi:hypothetical protein
MTGERGSTATRSNGERGAGPRAEAVVVMGMHRSGTSLTTRLLGLLGVDLGPERTMLGGIEGDNPKGFWEQAPLTELNDDIFTALGTHWWNPPELRPGWHERPELEPLRERAARLLDELFPEPRPWGFKDPRLSLTLPVWRPLVPDMRCVVCVRHPLDVAASLERRDPVAHPRERSIVLWLRYTAAALRESEGLPRMCLFFDDFFDAFDSQLARLARFVGREDALDQARADAEQFLEHDLRHHDSRQSDLLDDPDVPVEVAAAYDALRTGRDAERLVPRLWDAYESGRRAAGEAASAARGRALAERDAEELRARVSAASRQLTEVETSRARESATAARTLAEKELYYANTFAELEKEATNARAWARGLESAWVFRVTAPFRGLKDRLLRRRSG